jgi:hypothetical protein
VWQTSVQLQSALQRKTSSPMKDLVQTLRGYVKQRQRAYTETQKRNRPVPAMPQKREAIATILAQLDFIEGKPEHNQKLCIAAIAPKFKTILPSELADKPNLKTMRNNIINIIAACEDHVNAKPLFS